MTSVPRQRATPGRASTTPFLLGNGRENRQAAAKTVIPCDGNHRAARVAKHDRQHWTRLRTAMRRDFPLLCHLLGAAEFNRLAIGYLRHDTVRSTSLHNLSVSLEAFLESDVRWNAPIIRECARLERAHVIAVDAAHAPPTVTVEERDPAELLARSFRFQIHWQLFEEHWNLVRLRGLVGDDAEVAPEMEPTPEHGYWAIYRMGKRVVSERLAPLQFALLKMLAEGHDLGTACERQAVELSEHEFMFLRASVRGWIARWTSLAWFRGP